jgi:capsular exopolysaccharide synthesis family protein
MTSLTSFSLADLRLAEVEPSPVSPSGGRVITIQPGKNCRLVFLTEPTSLAVEQYKMLRRRLTSKHQQGGVLLITSSSPSEGKTLTSTNLAWCLADGGHSTCLVDLDFRAPGVGATLQCTFEDDGLEDVICGRRSLTDSICRVGDRPLSVVGIRQRVSLPGPLLAADRLGPIVAQLRSSFQWVVLDLPPATPMADVAEVLPHADGALLIVRSDQTKKTAIAGPLEILGSKLWGVVLNDSPIAASAYYGYYGVRRG